MRSPITTALRAVSFVALCAALVGPAAAFELVSPAEAQRDNAAPDIFAKALPATGFAYCHMNLIARRGISNFENLDLDDLSSNQAYEFLFSWAPLKLVGATGSPGNPVAAW